jgi:hypothetical protein
MSPMATNSTMKAAMTRMKFLLPWISLKRKMPHKAPTSPGPVEMMGNETTKDKAPLATNQPHWAIAHMAPHTKPGRIASGNNLGLFFMKEQYRMKYAVEVRKIPQKCENA